MSNIFHKIKFGIGIIKKYKTWSLAFLDYFGLTAKNQIRIHRLRNKIKYWFRTRTSDFGIINEIHVVKEYHKLLRYIKPNSKVIDIGAQIGVFSIFASKLAKNVEVYSYEPLKENFIMLNKNIQLNKVASNVKAFNFGLSGKGGEREITICEENTGGHGFYAEGDRKVKIKTITLKDVFDKNNLEFCDYLKIDCEGAEYEILYNTPQKYLEKIKSISMEYHKNDDIQKLKQFLEKVGFKVKIDKICEGMLYAERI